MSVIGLFYILFYYFLVKQVIIVQYSFYQSVELLIKSIGMNLNLPLVFPFHDVFTRNMVQAVLFLLLLDHRLSCLFR